jgi:hypothetical protein
MSVVTGGLILTFLLYALLLALVVVALKFFPKTFLGEPARAVIEWLPPFLGGTALRDWAARAAEELAKKRLAGQRTGETACRLAVELEAATMQAMLPLLEPAELERIVACPETGQERIGVTVPEALAIAAHVRKNKSRSEQTRLYDLAVANAQRIASRAPGDSTPHSCALQGSDHVCCTFAVRPLRCRPLHAIAVSGQAGKNAALAAGHSADASDGPRHEQIVAQGVELGLTRALQSAGLDANIYEINSALATALGIPDAAERWARGEDVFARTLRLDRRSPAAELDVAGTK